eukprot:4127235-Prymnesium_polylepis.1
MCAACVSPDWSPKSHENYVVSRPLALRAGGWGCGLHRLCPVPPLWSVPDRTWYSRRYSCTWRRRSDLLSQKWSDPWKAASQDVGRAVRPDQA